jgi:hypothetical protein
MRVRSTGVMRPESGRSKLTVSMWLDRSHPGSRACEFAGLESSTQTASENRDRASNTFVVICTEDPIYLLKTWVPTHTFEAVVVSPDCRFVWQ